MMQWWVRVAWASMLGLGVMSGLVRAGDERLPPPKAVPEPIIISPQPAIVMDGHLPSPNGAGVDPHYYYQAWREPPIGCWTHHNRFSCGTFKSEMRFLFGSCRSFFGEPCLKGAPYPPVPWSNAYAPNGGCSSCP